MRRTPHASTPSAPKWRMQAGLPGPSKVARRTPPRSSKPPPQKARNAPSLPLVKPLHFTRPKGTDRQGRPSRRRQALHHQRPLPVPERTRATLAGQQSTDQNRGWVHHRPSDRHPDYRRRRPPSKSAPPTPLLGPAPGTASSSPTMARAINPDSSLPQRSSGCRTGSRRGTPTLRTISKATDGHRSVARSPTERSPTSACSAAC